MDVIDTTPGLAWYVDAWAVHDGRIFVSRRPPDSIAAETTVFLSVPDLQPVPVGQISTALRATRSGFQEGFRDTAGNEIPFGSLRAIRSLVTRVYLGAGLGPEAPGAVGAPIDAPAGGGGAGSAYLERQLDEAEPLGHEGERLPLEPPPNLDNVVQTFAVATLLEWDPMLTGLQPEVVRAFVGWYATLVNAGLLDPTTTHLHSPTGFPQLGPIAQLFGASAVAAACDQITRGFPPEWYIVHGVPVTDWSRGHLAVVPLPGASQWDGRLTRLVEMHILPRVDRRFWRQHRLTVDIAPLVLVAAVRRGAHLGHLPGERSPVQRAYEMIQPGPGWETLPGAAEEAIESFIDDCLGGSLGTHPPSTSQERDRERDHEQDQEQEMTEPEAHVSSPDDTEAPQPATTAVTVAEATPAEETAEQRWLSW